MHIFPQLRKVEQKYGDVLAVIGVHSAKFPAERVEAGLRDAVRRYEIQHPVVNDADFRVWGEYAVRAWPTLFFIDPRGKVVGKHEGELPYEVFDRLLAEMVAEYDAQGLLAFLACRAVPGIEEVVGSRYRRSVAVGRTTGIVELEPIPGAPHILLRLRLGDLRDFCPAVSAEARRTGVWHGTALELWVTLFGEHRRVRHGGIEPDGEERRRLDELCRTLRHRLIAA
jgi:thiol-disulfide isomerase/thioredoxin